jgi:hypothetical protein
MLPPTVVGFTSKILIPLSIQVFNHQPKASEIFQPIQRTTHTQLVSPIASPQDLINIGGHHAAQFLLTQGFQGSPYDRARPTQSGVTTSFLELSGQQGPIDALMNIANGDRYKASRMIGLGLFDITLGGLTNASQVIENSFGGDGELTTTLAKWLVEQRTSGNQECYGLRGPDGNCDPGDWFNSRTRLTQIIKNPPQNDW